MSAQLDSNPDLSVKQMLFNPYTDHLVCSAKGVCGENRLLHFFCDFFLKSLCGCAANKCANKMRKTEIDSPH